MQRWWLGAIVAAIALLLPFYFLQFGSRPYVDENGSPLRVAPVAVFVFENGREEALPPQAKGSDSNGFNPVSRVIPPTGIWARSGSSRGAAAVGGLLVPLLLLAAIIYSFLPKKKKHR